ncbi:SDR family oxidoreductase [Pseudarthrobacter sp. J1738]|uniref:SDR family oxidoreductase n=1 Tax=unclassified Pseudarthrobacter TaxID=2647000 RepID=UPI003D2C4DA2
MTSIAIIGGHGKVALHVARVLSGEDSGVNVTSFIRKPEQSDDITAVGATPVVLDVENSTTEQIAEAIKGFDAVVWSAGAGGGAPERTYAVDRDAAIRSMDAAKAAGVKRYVMVSYLGAGPNHGVPPEDSFFAYAESKAAADAYLRATDLDWTVLGPGALTEESATAKITVVDSTPAQRSVSRENVALVVAAVVQRPDTIHRTIEFVDGAEEIDAAL